MAATPSTPRRPSPLPWAEPYGSGLGGGGFFLLRQAGAQPTYRFLDARERAPKAAYADMYRRNGKVDPRLSVDGPLAAAIPACRRRWSN